MYEYRYRINFEYNKNVKESSELKAKDNLCICQDVFALMADWRLEYGTRTFFTVFYLIGHWFDGSLLQNILEIKKLLITCQLHKSN